MTEEMTRLVRAELLKLRTTPMVVWSAVAAAASVSLGVVSGVVGAGRAGAAALDSAEGVRNVLSAASQATIVVLVVGIVAMTSEFRHNTVSSTFLVTPNRGRVVAAKLVASAVTGLAFAVLAALVTLALGLPLLAVEGARWAHVADELGLVLVGAMSATALYGMVGVGVGAMVRNQVAAVALGLVWMMTRRERGGDPGSRGGALAARGSGGRPDPLGDV